MTPIITPDHILEATDTNIHHDWNNAHDPVCTVDDGSIVRFECREASDGLITRDTKPSDVEDLEFVGHALTGPVAVNGASVGDVLAVEILEVSTGDWGFTYFRPGKGLFPDQFPHGGLYIWELAEEIGTFVNGIEIPLDPFPGVVGVALGEDGGHPTMPPRAVGGNLDTKYFIEGTTIYLPIEAEKAMVSIGDGHAGQGDGEVCVTAIEAPIDVTVRLSIRDDMTIHSPHFETTSRPWSTSADHMYCTTGIDPDLLQATKNAVDEMITHLVQTYGLSRDEAYILCSVAADLRINEVVNTKHVVSAHVPLEIFPEQ